jgi:hypothetical protein
VFYVALSRACFVVTTVTAVVLGAACRSAQPVRSGSISRVSPLTSGRGSDALGCEEILSARVGDAYEAVIRFRPEFLRPRGGPAGGNPNGTAPMIYVDDVRQGGPEMLRTIPVAAIVEVRYLSATAASDRFGPLYPGGVIAVRTRR